ncbi:hypothetical protein ACF0H5_015000 [Mactra antiquata]
MDITMSATVIVPQRNIPCTQWITFNGDNEPVINNGPDKEDGCDTFLKRLQKAKICNQNDPSLPSGQQFCFEAMVDKRYNRWKRRRRKKQSEARRVSVIQSSDSSDDNDDRDGAMERIIDKMYEQIHGPVPRTPNGSRETPRVRNRRRRKETSDESSTMAENAEQEPTLRYYDASSEWTSDGCHMSSSSACHFSNLEMTQDDKKVLSSVHTDELCTWPYLEQYKSEILKRLQNTPPELPESFERNDWLPTLENPSCDTPEAKQSMKPEIGDNMASMTEASVKEMKSPAVNIDKSNTLDNDAQIDRTLDDEKRFIDKTHTEEKRHGWLPEIENNVTDRPETEVEFTLDGNEDIIGDNEFDSEDAMEDFEPFIRVDGTPRQSPESPKKTLTETASFPELQYTLDPDNQGYSYKRWSRSQRSTPNKMGSPDLKPRLLSRMSASTWSDIGSETADCVSVVAVGDRQRQSSSVKPVNKQDVGHGIRDEHRPFRKSQKIAMPIKKQNVNVNLPSLTRNSRSQTVPYTGGKHSESRPLKSTKSSQRFQTHSQADIRRSRNLPTHTDNKVSAPSSAPGTSKDTPNMPDFLFRDYYLRSLYGNKVRMNSHVESNLKNTRVRKTITVDKLEIKVKKIKKKPEDSKPRDSAFTRSFTFSMFDLPRTYKVHNDNLERRANGEDIEAYE